MGVSKHDLFTREQNQLAAITKALAHPARIAIIDHLLKTKACVNGELVNELGLAQATVSQHLRELKELGIIQGTIEGPRMSYCINPVRWDEAKSLLAALFNRYVPADQSDCC